jgi:multidrug efflux pump
MNFTDIFIKRPVLAMVVSLFILVLGLRSISSLPVNQYPRTENAVVTVTTAYYGADAETIAGFITQPLEAAIAQAQGIDYMASNSLTGQSVITVTLRLNYDANRALTEINTQINSVKNQLPPASQQPVLTVQVGQTTDAMYMGFYSDVMPSNSVTDYLIRVVKPKLDSVEGVQTAEVLGGRQFALRAWLDADRMAAHGLTATDVSNALAANNYLAAVGASKGQMVTVDMRADTDLHTVEEFKHLVVKQGNGALVRLEDVATVSLGAENYDVNVAFSGRRAVFIGIKTAPEANFLDVAKRVRDVFPSIQAQFPTGVTGKIVYDATKFVNTSITEVVKTLIETLLIVTVVIYLFLGTLRAVVVPLVAMPLSLVGTFFIMLVLGYSINLLTLLALVLAIGLVVDDAIIVVENVFRHINEEGQKPFDAAILAARELGGPILAMTIVLVAVYIPIGFQGGLTGALFTEFAFSLAGSVTVSGIIALSLSPMMCARLFPEGGIHSRFADFLEAQFKRLHDGYRNLLSSILRTWSVVLWMGLVILLAFLALFKTAGTELAPNEDQGIVLYYLLGPPNATSDQMLTYTNQLYKIASEEPEYAQMFQLTGVPTINQGFGGMLTTTWDERTRSATQIQQDLQAKWNNVAGARVAAFQFPPLPGTQGYPVQFIINSTEPFQNIYDVATEVMDRARKSGKFYFLDGDLKIDKPQTTLVVDRDLVGSLGMTDADIGSALSGALGANYVNYFSISGRSYKVIPQVLQVDRLNPQQVLNYEFRTPNGTIVPISTIAHLQTSVVPETITHFQQLNSVTIGAVNAAPQGVTQGDALQFLRDTLNDVAGKQYSVDYSGQSRQFMKETGGFAVTLLFSIVIVFLALSAQFESFRDPIVILVSVPLALFGALIYINLFSTLNIYSQVGLVTLMGLISKHGILIVQFANEQQRKGLTKFDAIVEAASVRLRPILMTTAAMVLGVVPLAIASGAGAAGRQTMGWVVFAGLSIGTIFTLFVVPAMYIFLASDHAKVEASKKGRSAFEEGAAV